MTVAGSSVPKWFWIVAGVALLWNLMGVGAYIADVTRTDEALAKLPEAQQALYAAQPVWVTGAYAIAVFAGLLGSAALLFRKGLATPLFAVSLAAVIVQFGYLFLAMNVFAVMGAAAAVFPVVIIVIAAFLTWFSIQAKARAWIG